MHIFQLIGTKKLGLIDTSNLSDLTSTQTQPRGLESSTGQLESSREMQHLRAVTCKLKYEVISTRTKQVGYCYIIGLS